jgi:hypothetical protein
MLFNSISLNVGIVLAVSYVLLSITFIVQYWFCCCRQDDNAASKKEIRFKVNDLTINMSRQNISPDRSGYTPRGGRHYY